MVVTATAGRVARAECGRIPDRRPSGPHRLDERPRSSARWLVASLTLLTDALPSRVVVHPSASQLSCRLQLSLSSGEHECVLACFCFLNQLGRGIPLDFLLRMEDQNRV